MLLSALLPRLSSDAPHHTVFSKLPRRSFPTPISLPSLLQIQSSMEDAWNTEGFDPDGAKHYQHRIRNKSGQRAKIGAMEVANLCWYHGIDAVVVQFVTCSESRRLVPYFLLAYFAQQPQQHQQQQQQQQSHEFAEDASELAQNLLSKAATHYSKRNCGLPMQSESLTNVNANASGKSSSNTARNSSVEILSIAPLLPLYLQWEGHSVTVVGVQFPDDDDDDDGDRSGSLSRILPSSRSPNFLVLDPMKKSHKLQSDLFCSNQTQALPSSVTLPWDQISNKDLQIIVCTKRSMSYSERRACRSNNGANSLPPGGRVLTAEADAVNRHLLLRR